MKKVLLIAIAVVLVGLVVFYTVDSNGKTSSERFLAEVSDGNDRLERILTYYVELVDVVLPIDFEKDVDAIEKDTHELSQVTLCIHGEVGSVARGFKIINQVENYFFPEYKKEIIGFDEFIAKEESVFVLNEEQLEYCSKFDSE